MQVQQIDLQSLKLIGVDCVRGKKTILKGVNFTLEPGKVVALIGPNGAGKSTLITTLIGDIRPGDGCIIYGDTPVQELPQRSKVFGVVTEAHGLPGRMTVGGAVSYWAAIHCIDNNNVSTISKKFGIDAYLRKRIRNLSTGMRRRLEIVLAILLNPQVVVLDEPFNGLDLDGIETVRSLVRRLREEGKAILLSTHTFNEIDQLADQVYAVHNEQLIELDFTKGNVGATEAAYNSIRGGETA